MAEVVVEILNGVLSAFGRQMQTEFGAFRHEVRGEIDALRHEVRGQVGGLRREFRSELKAVHRRLARIERSLNGVKPVVDTHERRFRRIGRDAIS